MFIGIEWEYERNRGKSWLLSGLGLELELELGGILRRGGIDSCRCLTRAESYCVGLRTRGIWFK